MVNRGIVNFTDNSLHLIKYIVKDIAGNTSEAVLHVKSSPESKTPEKAAPAGALYFDCMQENKMENDEISMVLPQMALYNDAYFIYSKTLDLKAPYAPLFKIMTDETPLQKAYTLRIKATRLPDSLQQKACMVSINSKRKLVYEGGTYNSGWVSTQTKSLGDFTIAVDNTPPVITAAFNCAAKTPVDFSKSKTIKLYASDNLSGVKKYRAVIDGKWVLCEYDLKNSALLYTFDNSIQPGLHTFKIEVSDDKKNTASLSFTFKR